MFRTGVGWTCVLCDHLRLSFLVPLTVPIFLWSFLLQITPPLRALFRNGSEWLPACDCNADSQTDKFERLCEQLVQHIKENVKTSTLLRDVVHIIFENARGERYFAPMVEIV